VNREGPTTEVTKKKDVLTRETEFEVRQTSVIKTEVLNQSHKSLNRELKSYTVIETELLKRNDIFLVFRRVLK